MMTKPQPIEPVSYPLNIAVIGDGGSIHNRFFMEWLVQRGHRVTFLTDVPVTVPGAIVHRIVPRRGFGPLRHLIAGKRVGAYLRRFPPDIVHAHNVSGYGYWALLARRHPLVMTCWGSDVLRVPEEGYFQEVAIVESLRSADLITGDAHHLLDEARRLASPEAPLEWWQFGVPLERYSVAPTRGNPPIVLSTRRMRPLYRLETIIHAFRRVAEFVPKAQLVMIGDDYLRPDLEALVRELGLSRRVLFPGWTEEAELRDWYARASVFVSVPESDSTPVSLLEAFASSLPVVLSDLPANREWVTQNRNGAIVPVGDVDATAHAISEMLLQPERSKRWGRENRLTAEKHCGRNTNMLQMEQWYRELLRAPLRKG